jgi:hypothetical protein
MRCKVMSNGFSFIEVKSEEQCWYCGRRKLNQNEKSYRVYAGASDVGIVVCELCRVGFLTRFLEGSEKTYAAHLVFYVKRSLLEIGDRLPSAISVELNSAIENYENGKYVANFRSIGYVAEWLTTRLFTKKLGVTQEEELSWEDKLGRLLAMSKKNKKIPEEALAYQLFSLKWFRNEATHPSEYKITGEEVRLGLVSIVYLLHQTFSYNLV